MSESLKIKSRFCDYEVLFEDDFVLDLKTHFSDQSFIIIDEKVLDLYQKELSFLMPSGRMLVVAALEENKSLEQCVTFIQKLIQMNIRKNSILVAIGGGIIQDISAFLASILFRGIKWQFYPTTLLAQADSCIGSKNSINIDSFKNLVGTFYPPSRIFSSTQFLQTLTESEIKSGIGEMLHFYFFRGREEANELASCYHDLLIQREKLKPFIRKSLEIKKTIVEKDELDQGIRNLFNYGHTFGHAVEAVSNFEIPHGQAITLGMDMANYVSLRIGLLAEADYYWMKRILALNKPSFKMGDQTVDFYLKVLSKDKKNTGDKLGCILTRGPGKLEKHFLLFDNFLTSLILDYFK